MDNLVSIGLLFAVSLGAVAQVSSNGPVVKDYGKQVTAEDPIEAKLAKEVRHEILMLPWYSLFDDIEFSVQGRMVTLSGFVTRDQPATGSVVKKVVRRTE